MSAFVSLSVIAPRQAAVAASRNLPSSRSSLTPLPVRTTAFVPNRQTFITSQPPCHVSSARQPIRCDTSETSVALENEKSTKVDWKDQLAPGSVAEVWVNAEVRFASVTGLYERGILAACVELGEDEPTLAAPVKVSFGEVVSVWTSSIMDADFTSAEALPELIQRGLRFLKRAPSRSLDITKIYNQMHRLPKAHPQSSLSSEEISKVLFPERRTDTPDRRATITAATAMLIASENIRFKRGQPGMGWRALPTSVALSRGRTSFVDACNSILSTRATDRQKKHMWTRDQIDILHELEIIAASGSVATGVAANALEKLGYERTDSGAAALLLDIRHWTTGSVPRTKITGQDADIQIPRAKLSESGLEDSSGNEKDSWAESEQSDTNGKYMQSKNVTLKDWTFPPAILEEAKDLRMRYREKKFSILEGDDSCTSRWRRNLFRPVGGGSPLKTYCVDVKNSRFLDDAISVESFENNSLVRLYVHIADVDEIVRSGSPIDELAKERGQSLYLPLRPLHMLPGAVMEAASFSTALPSEAISIMVDFDVDEDVITNWEVYPSIVPPVTKVSYEQFDGALEDGTEVAGLRESDCADLKLIAVVSALLAEKLDRRKPNRKLKSTRGSPDQDNTRNKDSYDARSVASVRLVKRTNRVSKHAVKVAEVVDFQSTGSHTAINQVLTCAGGLIRQFAKENRAYLPEDRLASAYVARCGTAPLRRYSDLAIQRQVKCVLFGRPPAGKRRMDDLRAWLAKRQSAGERTVAERRKAALYDSLSNHCAQLCSVTGIPQAIVKGKVRNFFVTKKGTPRVDIAIEGTGLMTTASFCDELRSSILNYVGDNAEAEASKDETKPSSKEALLAKTREIFSPGTNVRIRIAEVNAVMFTIQAYVVGLAE